MRKQRVVITGMGIVCANAGNSKEFAKALFEGKSGIRTCHAFDTTGLSTDCFGEVSALQAKNRFTELLEKSTKEMMDSAGVTSSMINRWGRNCRMFFGTLIFSSDYFYRHSLAKCKEQPADDEIARINEYTDYAKELTGVRGNVNVISASCASGTTAIGMAFDYLRSGLCESAVAGGVDSLSLVTAYGFNALKNMSSSVCNPFDQTRDGITIGECGAMFLFETLEHAKARGAKIIGEIAGYAIGNDAYHITSPEPHGNGAYHTMQEALADAGITASDIDYINAHGTGTLINDDMELKAIERLLENTDHTVSVSSTKALLGHCMGASGAIELASILLSIKEEKYIPMPNLQKSIVQNKQIRMMSNTSSLWINYALSNSFAFGGNSAAIVVKRYEGDGTA